MKQHLLKLKTNLNRLSDQNLRGIEIGAEFLVLCFMLGFCFSLMQAEPLRGITSPIINFTAQFLPKSHIDGVKQALIRPQSHEDLNEIFAARDYELAQVQSGDSAVPAVFLASLPHDLHTIAQPSDKKDLFIRAVLPTILLVNERIASQRSKLLALQLKQSVGRAFDKNDQEFLAAVSGEYGVSDQSVEALLRRVDIIPPSLALAQAAEESGWGTSRFARIGNALYGQQVYNASQGMMPGSREAGRTHMVRSFNNLYETVLSYSRNLNSHPAYEGFRAVRADMRRAGQNVDSFRLIDTLISYSERREEYVKTLKRIIQVNDLKTLDRAKLEGQKIADASSSLRSLN